MNFVRLAGMLLSLAWPTIAAAQGAPALRPHHLMIEFGATSTGGYDIGMSSAVLRGNGTGATPPPFTLFTADSRITPSVAGEGRLGFAVTRRLAVEFAATQSNPRIAVAISADEESAAQQLPGEEVQQYVFEGGVNWQLPWAASRVAPFVTGGAGLLRQLHEDRTLGDDGLIYYAGGGVRWWLRGGSGTSTAIGMRLDARINLCRAAIDFEDKLRKYPRFAVSVFFGL